MAPDVSTMADLIMVNGRQPYVMCDGSVDHPAHRVPVIITGVQVVWDGDKAQGRYEVVCPDPSSPTGLGTAVADPTDLHYAA